MSRFGRIHRGPDHWDSPHRRARARLVERIDGPLGISEATWLDEHLAGCPACTTVAQSYDDDRQVLRALRDEAPPLPRDLWARTASAIEQRAAFGGRRDPASSFRRPSRVPVGALSGLAVIAVVVGVSAISGGWLDGRGESTDLGTAPGPTPEVASTAVASSPGPQVAGPAATPFMVGAGEVRWFGKEPDGMLAYNAAAVDTVCPIESDQDCATLDRAPGDQLALAGSPRSIIGSPTRQQAVVVTDDGAGGQRLTVLSLPAPATDPVPPATPTAVPTAPPATLNPGGSRPPGGDPSPTPPSATEPPATPAPTPTPTPTESGDPGASVTPEPTIATSLAIASDVAVTGESAAFSADGAWFAFSAQPVDRSTGPDVYVWHVGDDAARPVTGDGRSYFASWDGLELVVSRPGPLVTDGMADAASVLVDPVTGLERPAGDLWRPAVDPTGLRAVAWVGTVSVPADGIAVSPAVGRLELLAWSREVGALDGDGATQVVIDAPLADFDVRWDETGEWFAAWIADPSGTDVGRLSLFRVDTATGLLVRPEGAPVDVPALAGFSLGAGRLAWATPPGQGGEGSRVQIVAWASDGVGTVETAPGRDLIVVR